MKKLILKALNKTAVLLGWRWLYFIAGICLISIIESCKSGAESTRTCYAAARVPMNSQTVTPADSIGNGDAPADTINTK